MRILNTFYEPIPILGGDNFCRHCMLSVRHAPSTHHDAETRRRWTAALHEQLAMCSDHLEKRWIQRVLCRIHSKSGSRYRWGFLARWLRRSAEIISQFQLIVCTGMGAFIYLFAYLLILENKHIIFIGISFISAGKHDP